MAPYSRFCLAQFSSSNYKVIANLFAHRFSDTALRLSWPMKILQAAPGCIKSLKKFLNSVVIECYVMLKIQLICGFFHRVRVDEGERERFPWGLGYAGVNPVDPGRWSSQLCKPRTSVVLPPHQKPPRFGEALLGELRRQWPSNPKRGETKGFHQSRGKNLDPSAIAAEYC